ncbi:hypothetical protein M2459_001634 [Parabacteroides sp. PF5-5]|uniref:head GIN domain-containing protein n=1 Tax=unclassified Parabacteroides TaxID=2649774 RepID=UPI002475A7B6|nr:MULTISPECIES: head GIN domain-containing protein [unclassified Parabacteroides]MDH6304897.1 hypothetical protein [Parabacteroides sp. PH5-39]MDH6316017.1 hypothetical protein [Parabacteroides sp. PF5-13]MDH6319674.1 hypothetical protein [Parabacteroides sp. PH5-13]MDH6323405.1 hypothetical protein [Parabacteroides sp. PH5-8]MDH6327086.1 hypothetical protein [Parabacteroides sp. PH5-41]
MNTKFFITLACSLVLFMNSCNPFQMIIGDGNLTTQEINIEDYNVIEAAQTMTINYTQSEDAPMFTVTTDQNILEMYDIRTSGNKLFIKPKDEFRRANFRPTEFTVTTRSKGLKKAEVAGSVHFNVDNTFTGDNLELDLAGSGTINLRDSVFVDILDVDLAGSATLNATYMNGRKFDGDIAGSGKLNMGGIMTEASLDIAGSGTVRAFDLQVEDLKCDIAGSGDIEISVSNSISADIAGSGRIKYKGNPQTVRKSVAGSGSIKQVD